MNKVVTLFAAEKDLTFDYCETMTELSIPKFVKLYAISLQCREL